MQLLAVKTCVQKCTSTPPARGDLLTINVFQTMSVLLAGCPLCLLSCLGFNVVSLCLSANSSCLKNTNAVFPVRFDVLSGQLQLISLFVWSKIDSPVSQKPCEVTLVRWPRAPWSVEMLLVCCHLQTLVLLWVLKPNCNDFLCTGHVLFYSQHLFYWNIFFSLLSYY